MDELLCPSKETIDALHETLADSFLTQVSPPTNKEYCYCHQAYALQAYALPNIIFSPEDMLVKNFGHD